MTDTDARDIDREGSETSPEPDGGVDPIARFTDEVEEKVERANEIHNSINEFIQWSREQAASVRSRADILHELDMIDDEDRANYYQAARRIRTVAQRLEINKENE